jgi:hypothetical protein
MERLRKATYVRFYLSTFGVKHTSAADAIANFSRIFGTLHDKGVMSRIFLTWRPKFR